MPPTPVTPGGVSAPTGFILGIIQICIAAVAAINAIGTHPAPGNPLKWALAVIFVLLGLRSVLKLRAWHRGDCTIARSSSGWRLQNRGKILHDGPLTGLSGITEDQRGYHLQPRFPRLFRLRRCDIPPELQVALDEACRCRESSEE